MLERKTPGALGGLLGAAGRAQQAVQTKRQLNNSLRTGSGALN